MRFVIRNIENEPYCSTNSLLNAIKQFKKYIDEYKDEVDGIEIYDTKKKRVVLYLEHGDVYDSDNDYIEL